jgi:fumarate hydratase, class I
MIPNCAATRHAAHPCSTAPARSISIRPTSPPGPSSPTTLTNARRVNLDTVTRAEAATWKPGEVLLLTGKLLTGRDAAHKRMTDMLNRGEKLPVDFRGRFIYYVGPVDPVRDEAVGPAGPTTATRMDKFTRQMLAETGLLGMVGKAERGPEAIAAIREFGAVYLMAVGGAAYLVSKAITRLAPVLAFPDLGMEAIYEFDVRDMPVTVAVDSKGTSVHQTGPAEWQQRIAGIPMNSQGAIPVRVPSEVPLCIPAHRPDGD